MQVARDRITVVGSRETPPEWLSAIQQVGETMATAGWVLRSGGAPGADEYAERGWDQGRKAKEIYEPWPGWRNWEGRLMPPQTDVDWIGAEAIAKAHHPNWPAIKRAGLLTFRLMCRNSFQVLGPDLKTKSRALIAWTPKGSGSGGTGQALRIARAYAVPILDMGALSHPADAYRAAFEFIASLKDS